MRLKVLIRGGGDLASGAARRLHLAGMRVVVLEREQPRAIRRTVSFAEAVYSGQVQVEGVNAKLCSRAPSEWRDYVTVLVDEQAETIGSWQPDAVVDARMLKRTPADCSVSLAPLVVGLGPGFVVGKRCHAIVETNRGHNLGRVIREGEAEADTGVPGAVCGYTVERVLRSPSSGVLSAELEIGDAVKAGQVVGRIGGKNIVAQIGGVLRGLMHPGIRVSEGEKVGDIDPRGQRDFCFSVSDKANAIAGGVLEAILSVFGTGRDEC